MSDLIKPSFQTKPYKASETIRVRDRYQQYVWLENSIEPCDLYCSNGDVVMIFPKNEQTKELYKRWKNREFKQERVKEVGD